MLSAHNRSDPLLVLFQGKQYTLLQLVDQSLKAFPCQVRFCSDECRSEAWELFHKLECQQLKLILNAGVGKNATLALRILTSSGKIYLEYIIGMLRDEAERRKNHPDFQRTVGFSEDTVYDSCDYRCNWSLMSGVADSCCNTCIFIFSILEPFTA